MNNFLIFRWSFFHLLADVNLYQLDPGNHNDLFKYSPSFALLMAPFAALPPLLGGVLWNLCGAGLLAAGIAGLPAGSSTKQSIFWVSLPEFIGSTQGFQANIHMVGLLLLFFGALEEKKPLRAALFLTLTFYIKIFGILGLGLLMFSNYSWKDLKFFAKLTLGCIGFFVGLFALPAIFVGFDPLIQQYGHWLHLLKSDSSRTYGFSLMGLIFIWTQTHMNSLYIQVAGGLTWLAAFFFGREGHLEKRLWGLVSLLYFLVVFNHKAESPTFIIPMVGFGIHLSLVRNKKLWWSLLLLTLGMVSLAYSDLFPREFKQTVADIYCFKIWPFIVLFPLSLFEICRRNNQARP